MVRWTMVAWVLLLGVGCRKQVAPVAVVVPPLAPEILDERPNDSPVELPSVAAAPRDCAAIAQVVGQWTLVTEVSGDVGGGIGGINGYYRLDLDEVAGDGCSVKATLRKEGYGRGSLQHKQVMFGESYVRNVDDSWPVAVNMAAGGEVLRLVFWLRPTPDGRLEGFWHYMNASWKSNPLYGAVEARRSDWDGGVSVSDAPLARLAECALADRSDTGPRTCAPGGLAR